MFSQLEKHGSQLALDLLQTLNTRIERRRLSEVINLKKYLLDPAYVDKSTKRSEIQKNAKCLLKRLYPVTEAEIENSSEINGFVEPANVNIIIAENPMIDELKECIRKTTASRKYLENEFDTLNKDFKLFELTGTKSKNILLLEQALYSMPCTSVEAERAFSSAVLFITKLRSSLSDSSLDSLVFLEGHFKSL